MPYVQNSLKWPRSVIFNGLVCFLYQKDTWINDFASYVVQLFINLITQQKIEKL
jgi:hypothetical protein